jgi:hypothetical protein
MTMMSAGCCKKISFYDEIIAGRKTPMVKLLETFIHDIFQKIPP